MHPWDSGAKNTEAITTMNPITHLFTGKGKNQ